MKLREQLKMIVGILIGTLLFVQSVLYLIERTGVCHNKPEAVIELINETAGKHHMKPYDILIEIDENNNIYLRENLYQYTGECDGEVLETIETKKHEKTRNK